MIRVEGTISILTKHVSIGLAASAAALLSTILVAIAQDMDLIWAPAIASPTNLILQIGVTERPLTINLHPLEEVNLPAIPKLPVWEEPVELLEMIVTGEYEIDRYGDPRDDRGVTLLVSAMQHKSEENRARHDEETTHDLWHAAFWKYLPAFGASPDDEDAFMTPSYLQPMEAENNSGGKQQADTPNKAAANASGLSHRLLPHPKRR